jgi:N-acetyl-beta-hexosaminidase
MKRARAWPLCLVFAVAGCAHGGGDVSDGGGGSSGGGGGGGGPSDGGSSSCQPGSTAALENVIPRPVSMTESGGIFCLPATARIVVDPGATELVAIGDYLAEKLRPATGYALQVAASDSVVAGDIRLTLGGGDPALGDEGYELDITVDGVTLSAYRPAGLFRGLQTLRQLLPAAIERTTKQSGPWPLATGVVRDHPRFGWRGAMLDVARHFFSVADVERYIDLLAYYKINRFHLHLSDDQGWRIVLSSWPQLSTIGGSTQVGGANGSFYFSQADYAEIIAYAGRRYITVIPEIDMPGHTNAALASYAELNCDGVAPPLYTGTNVGFSSLCIGKAITDTFVHDIVGEIARMTPGPWFHVGGDEANVTSPSDYVKFVQATQSVVGGAGKAMIGWADIAQTTLTPSSIAQHWSPNNPQRAQQAVQQNIKVIMSPAERCYLDMKYDSSTRLGTTWAGFVDEERAYTWDPATEVAGVTELDILGVESPLWTETIRTHADIDYMAFPRIVGHAEIGWSPASGRSWDEYKTRMGSHGPRLTAMNVSFYRSSRIPWQ